MFIDNKYTKWYYSIIDRAIAENRVRLPKHVRSKMRASGESFIYYESHHIVPKCMGGVDEVLLTAKEHFICHLMLTRMTIGRDKHRMINAVSKMAFMKSSQGQQRYTSRAFTLLRRLVAERNHEMFFGKKKSPEAIARMKSGGTGKWVRTDKHRRDQSNTNAKLCGTDNKATKLTIEQVKEIKSSELGARKLSTKYGISRSQIQNIKRGRLWKYVVAEKEQTPQRSS